MFNDVYSSRPQGNEAGEEHCNEKDDDVSDADVHVYDGHVYALRAHSALRACWMRRLCEGRLHAQSSFLFPTFADP